MTETLAYQLLKRKAVADQAHERKRRCKLCRTKSYNWRWSFENPQVSIHGDHALDPELLNIQQLSQKNEVAS